MNNYDNEPHPLWGVFGVFALIVALAWAMISAWSPWVLFFWNSAQ